MELVKATLLDCMEKSHPPTSNRVQHLAYILSYLHDHGDERKVEPASQRVLSVLTEALKESFSQCSAMLDQNHYAANTKLTLKYPHNASHSSWQHLNGLLDGSPLPFFLPALCTLSHHISQILHILNELVDTLALDHAFLLASLAERVWGVGLTSLLHGPLYELMALSECHTFLARMALCLVVADVMDVVISVCAYRRKGVSTCSCVEKWRWKEVLVLLNDVERDFPAVLFQWYCHHEEEEKMGREGDETTDHMLKSVHFIVDSISVLEMVAKGCGHMQLQRTNSEYALRLVSQSITHLHQLSALVPARLPGKWLYIVLASLEELRLMLTHLHAHQDLEELCVDACLRVEEKLRGVLMQLECYHIQLCLTSLLQDADCNNWCGHTSFYEGERCSWTVQMWAYHMRALQSDLWTYLPDSLQGVRVDVLRAVLGACLCHLVSRYTTLSPTQAHSAHLLADVLVVLSCAASLLPWLGSAAIIETASSPHQMGIHSSCNLLVAMAVVVTCSLPHLHQILIQLLGDGHEWSERRDEGILWLSWLQEQLHLCVSMEEDHSVPPTVQSQLPFGLLQTHPSHMGALLQVLLADNAALCVQLCLEEEMHEQKGIQLEGGGFSASQAVLEVLSRCPQVEWALAAVVCGEHPSLVHRDTGYYGNGMATLVPYSKSIPAEVWSVFGSALGPILFSHMLSKAAAITTCDGSSDVQGDGCGEVLQGLQELLQARVSLPILRLLQCVAAADPGAEGCIGDTLARDEGCIGDTLARAEGCIGDTLARVLARVLRTFVSGACSDLSSALAPSLSSATGHLQHVFQLLFHSLDPSWKPPDNDQLDITNFTSLSASTSQQLHDRHSRKWEECRRRLGNLLPSPSASISTMLAEELRCCTLEEHELAAEVISSNEEGLLSLQRVHAAVRDLWSGSSNGCSLIQPNVKSRFNPIKEYCNVGVSGSWHATRRLSQKKLMTLGNLDNCSLTMPSLLWLVRTEGPRLNNLIRKWRCEWQGMELSPDINPSEQHIAADINSHLLLLQNKYQS